MTSWTPPPKLDPILLFLPKYLLKMYQRWEHGWEHGVSEHGLHSPPPHPRPWCLHTLSLPTYQWEIPDPLLDMLLCELTYLVVEARNVTIPITIKTEKTKPLNNVFHMRRFLKLFLQLLFHHLMRCIK